MWPEGVRLEDMRQTLDFGGIDEGTAEKSELNGDRKGEEEQRTKNKDREAEKEEEKRTHKEPVGTIFANLPKIQLIGNRLVEDPSSEGSERCGHGAVTESIPSCGQIGHPSCRGSIRQIIIDLFCLMTHLMLGPTLAHPSHAHDLHRQKSFSLSGAQIASRIVSIASKSCSAVGTTGVQLGD